MDLADKQAQLLADVGAPKTEMQELNGQLRQRKKQIDAKINKNLQDPTTADLDQLVADVQELVTEANQLVTRADEIAGTNLGTPTVETMNALDLTRSVLVSSGKLIQDARGAPAPEQSETRLKQLLTRRLALLRDELMRVRRRAQLTQIVTWLEVADVSERVLNAELELCQTRLERIARRQRHLEQFRKFEAQVLAEIRSGRGQAAVSDPAHVEIRRLKFEIELQRELIREPPEKKSVEAAVEQGKLPGW
jgi:hypothetical protein